MHESNQSKDPDYIGVMMLALMLLFTTVFLMNMANQSFAQTADATVVQEMTYETIPALRSNIEQPWSIHDVPQTPAMSYSLQDRVVAELARIVGGDPATLRITFNADDAVKLQREAAHLAVQLETAKAGRLGVVSYQLRLDDGQGNAETLRLRPRVERRVKVVIARRSLQRGDLLKPTDVQVVDRYVTRQTHLQTRPTGQLAGLVVQRAIGQGDIIAADDLEQPLLVHRGRTVTLRCVSGQLVIKTLAQAQDDGALNDIVQVRDMRTRQRHRAVVTGHGEVTLTPPGNTPGSKKLKIFSPQPPDPSP